MSFASSSNSARCPSPDLCRNCGCQGQCATGLAIRLSPALRALSARNRFHPAGSCADQPRRRRKGPLILSTVLP